MSYELKIKPTAPNASVAHLDNVLQIFAACVGDDGVKGQYRRDGDGCYTVRAYISLLFVEEAIKENHFEIVEKKKL